MRADHVTPVPLFRIRPRRLGCLINGCLFLFALPMLGLGLATVTGTEPLFGILFIGLGILVGVVPNAYFARAEVKLKDGVLRKVILFWTVARCPEELVGSIRWYQWGRNAYDRGYEFVRTDGRRIFRLSAFWWSDKDVARLGQQLGLKIDWGAWHPPGLAVK